MPQKLMLQWPVAVYSYMYTSSGRLYGTLQSSIRPLEVPKILGRIRNEQLSISTIITLPQGHKKSYA